MLSDTIKPGDVVVVEGLFGLEEGDKVQEVSEIPAAEDTASKKDDTK